MSLYSCRRSPYPNHSENFTREFVDEFFNNYSVQDAQLSYFTAQTHEIEISPADLRLARIDETDQNLFLSGTKVNYPLKGVGNSYTVFVYQHKDAPIPMKDWTVKSISLLSNNDLTLNSYNDDSVDRYKNLMNDFINSGKELNQFENNDENKVIIDAVNNAYTKAEKHDREPQVISDNNVDIIKRKYYILLIEFEENPNIVWYSYLYGSGENLYIRHQFYAEPQYQYESYWHNYYGSLSDECFMFIKDLLLSDGWLPIEDKTTQDNNIVTD